MAITTLPSHPNDNHRRNTVRRKRHLERQERPGPSTAPKRRLAAGRVSRSRNLENIRACSKSVLEHDGR